MGHECQSGEVLEDRGPEIVVLIKDYSTQE